MRWHDSEMSWMHSMPGRTVELTWQSYPTCRWVLVVHTLQ